MTNGNDKCTNCGGDSGIHHYQTNQCPVGGVEAPIGREQEWKTSVFAPTVEWNASVAKTIGSDGAFAFAIDWEMLQPGMTKREYFAAMAMQGFCAKESSQVTAYRDKLVQDAVAMADALIEALNGEK